MYQEGVKLSDIEEEKCLKASPLTLTGIIKGPIEGEEGEKRQSRKRKKTEIVEVPREPVPTTKPIEESDSEKKGGYEVCLEQPMLSSLQMKQHQLKLELKKKEKEELQVKRETLPSC